MKQDATNRFDASGDREKAGRIEVCPMGVVVLDQLDQLFVQRGDDEIGGECRNAFPFPRAEERGISRNRG